MGVAPFGTNGDVDETCDLVSCIDSRTAVEIRRAWGGIPAGSIARHTDFMALFGALAASQHAFSMRKAPPSR